MSENLNADRLIEKLARADILALTPYASARREASCGEVWLNANESPWNNSEVAQLNRYPDCQPAALRQAYADYAKVDPKQVLICRGADEGIDLLLRAFCKPNHDTIASFTPSYGMYAISAQTQGIHHQAIPWGPEYALPLDLTAQLAKVKLLFLCNPNNPSGTLIPTSQIIALAKQQQDTLIVVDEAYIDFCPDHSCAASITKLPNLVILRTLSKAFSLAGARCGFVLACEPIIALLEKVIAPYPIPMPVAQLAQAALNSCGIQQMMQQVQELNRLRLQLIQQLLTFADVTVLPSIANFVLFHTPRAQQVMTQLSEQGIILRSYQVPALHNWLRVSVGDQQQMQQLYKQLQILLMP